MKYSLPVLGLFAVLFCGTVLAGESAPRVVISQTATRDAPEIDNVTLHARGRQNMERRWMAFGPNGQGERVLYMGLVSLRQEGADEQATPVMLRIDPRDGSLKGFYRVLREQASEQRGRGATGQSMRQVERVWRWGPTISGAANQQFVYLGAQSTEHEPAALVVFDPGDETFREITSLPSDPVAIFNHQGDVHVLLANGVVRYQCGLTGDLLTRVRLAASFEHPLEMVHLDGDDYVAKVATSPVRLLRISLKGSVEQVHLFDRGTIESLRLGSGAAKVLAGAVVYEPGRGAHELGYAVDVSGAKLLDSLPQLILTDPDSPWQATFDWDAIPPRIAFRDGDDAAWHWHGILISGAFHDNVRQLIASEDGSTIYTTGWPVAWVARYDTATGAYRTLGRLYNIYEMRWWHGQIWMTAYTHQRLFRWNPDQPWTFGQRHSVVHGHGPTPWGLRDQSNPELVAGFRQLNRVQARRSSGLIMDRRDTIWVGSRTPPAPHVNLGVRFSGAINWFDPEVDTLGQIREPFVHYAVRDMSLAGPDHVLAVSQSWASPYEPLPEGYAAGKLTLVNVDSREVVFEDSPTGAALTYAREVDDKRVVIYSRAARGRFDQPHRGMLLIFDVAQRRVTDVVLMQVAIAWGEYNALPFLRGPDGRIYFYGHDEDGVALFRFDADRLEVQAVLRHAMITGAQAQISGPSTPGARIAFTPERVFFGARALVSVPLATVVGDR